MMHIRIKTPIAELTADLAEEQVSEILRKALSYALGSDPSVSSQPNNPTSAVVSSPITTEPVQKRTHTLSDFPDKVEFKGFLFLKCEECGKFKAFMPKTPIHKHRCDCGHTTILRDVRAMVVECKCGARFKYLTNAKDSILSIDCYNCGSPVDLEYHERKKEYVTIKEEMN